MAGRYFCAMLLFTGCATGGAAGSEPVEVADSAPTDDTAVVPESAVVDDTASPTPITKRTLQHASGNGSVVIYNWPGTDPLVVRFIDEKGSGIAGAAVAWKVESGMLRMTPDVMTDADGFARARIAGEFVPPSLSFTKQLVSATAEGQRVDFHVTTLTDNRPNPPLNPHAQMETSRSIIGKAGTTLPAGVVVLVAAQSGPSSGQPLSDVGIRIVGDMAECVGGTVLTNDKGRATCDLVLKKAGSGSFDVLIGGAVKFAISAEITP
jgi:hypothetical protein